MKRITTLLLCLSLIISCCAVTSAAGEETYSENGQSEQNLCSEEMSMEDAVNEDDSFEIPTEEISDDPAQEEMTSEETSAENTTSEETDTEEAPSEEAAAAEPAVGEETTEETTAGATEAEEETSSEETTQEESYSFTLDPKSISISFDGYLPDNDMLYEGFVEQQLGLDRSGYEDNEKFAQLYSSSYAGDTLTGKNKLIYDALKSAAHSVATGVKADSIIPIDISCFGSDGSITAEEIGLEPSELEHASAEEIKKAVEEYLWSDIDLSRVFWALYFDNSFELYWMDFGQNIHFLGVECIKNGNEILISDNQVNCVIGVGVTYAAPDVLYVDGWPVYYIVDRKFIDQVNSVMVNAAAIVAKYSGCSDYEKITGYADEICALTDYDYDAASYGYTGDKQAQQLLNVFDGDPSTKVVCEGYAKAFQYLCELSSFSDGVHSIMTLGSLNYQRHAWNVVTMEDGRNYLVDVTWSDEGDICTGEYILKGAAMTYIGKYYVVGKDYYFNFESESAGGAFPGSQFVLSETDYGIVPDGSAGEGVLWTLRDDGNLFIYGEGEMDDSNPWQEKKDSVTQIIIGSGIRNVSDYAFKDFDNLWYVNIAEGVESIGTGAFQSCETLNMTDMPASMKSIGSYAFEGCSNLACMEMPEGITCIGDYTFSQCTLMFEVTLPESLEIIGSHAFYGCTGLRKMELPDNVTGIGANAFEG
ncbi:MAG: leucine-rich repeat protein, partial [Parasporobacterium sp.]|nr:leucine-rich repeat protein [Parasporobacterium sp.]